jgi:hypothetical protein
MKEMSELLKINFQQRGPTLIPAEEVKWLAVFWMTSAWFPLETAFPFHYVVLVRKRTIPTERPPLVGEISPNFCG